MGASAGQLILECYRKRDKQALLNLKSQLTEKLAVLDKFFEEYLDVYSDQMSATEDQGSPVWRAYKDKFKENEFTQADLKLVDYYLGML